ncbi:ABC/ECF transporter, transmembrane component [Parasponia andersonii]|uniref:ABC/ECF transporter, transmembrane component n=1 Tax=Parasponia andersonii TaxID=3476 RepID=A0A2P5E3T7_PARAD|nr:ABC/ECF transporter, transmembrane component [Parasponia andersonii]
MNCTHCTVATVTFLSLPSNPTRKTHQLAPSFSHFVSVKQALKASKLNEKTSFRIRASSTHNSGTGSWVNRLPTGALAADKVLRLIAGATASPICQYVSSPSTFLHSVDPRIKLVWLLALVVVPARSHIILRFGLVIYLALLSIWILPRQAWMDQLGRVSLLSGILFIMLGLGSDGVPSLVQSRTPPPAVMGLPNLPLSLGGYSYSIMKLGPLHFTRKGFSVASTAACLTFTVFQSASLCLTTTTPEQVAFALRWFMLPLTNIGVPVAEIILTLMLSLRFINLVRNVALGIISRRINWEQLTMLETIDIFFAYFRRIFKNIFNHAEQISQAMIVRGFRGDSKSHTIYFLSDSSFGTADIVSLLCLVGVIAAAVVSDYLLV